MSAPTSCGKTTVFELASASAATRRPCAADRAPVVALLQKPAAREPPKIVYVAPIKALCQERLVSWKAKFPRLLCNAPRRPDARSVNVGRRRRRADGRLDGRRRRAAAQRRYVRAPRSSLTARRSLAAPRSMSVTAAAEQTSKRCRGACVRRRVWRADGARAIAVAQASRRPRSLTRSRGALRCTCAAPADVVWRRAQQVALAQGRHRRHRPVRRVPPRRR